jgi:hypothetical protein
MDEASFASLTGDFFLIYFAQALGLAYDGKSLVASQQGFIIKCPGLDSNQHELSSHAPQACASTNFATRANIFVLIGAQM